MEEKYKNIHQDVISRCLNGERYAQSELYSLYSKAMFNICYRITNDRDDAEDVLQESFVSAFKNLSSYNGTASFGAWLKRIVINKSLNFIKKNTVEVVPIEDHDRYEIADTEQEYEFLHSVEDVKKAIELLPDGYRLVFSLYLLEGYDHREIAEILDITESTSKSQYNRSKKKLREILNKEGNYEGQIGTTG